MDTRMLRYFEATCRLGSVSSAARSLGVTQQAVSAAIRRIEGEVGESLLSTGRGKAMPTRYGKAFLSMAKDCVAAMDRFDVELRTLKAHDANVVRVGAIAGFLGYMGESFAEQLDGRGSTLFEEYSNNDVAEEDLLSGRQDLMVMSRPGPLGTISHPLVKESHYLWLPKKSPLAARKELTLSDLDGMTMCYLDIDRAVTADITSSALRSGANITLLPVSEVIRIYEYALRGEAVGLTTFSHVRAISSQRLAAVPLSDLCFGYYVCHRTDAPLNNSASEFLSFLIERCSAPQTKPSGRQ